MFCDKCGEPKQAGKHDLPDDERRLLPKAACPACEVESYPTCMIGVGGPYYYTCDDCGQRWRS